MKGITLYPPWSVWVCIKWKTIETRTHDKFRSLIGQRIVIHTALKPDINAFFNPWIAEKTSSFLDAQNIGMMVDLSLGKIVCTAQVAKGEWADQLSPSQKDQLELETMIDINDRYLLFLEDIRPVWPMIPFKGHQGIFEVPDELIKQGVKHEVIDVDRGERI
jgi:hypothetical protein